MKTHLGFIIVLSIFGLMACENKEASPEVLEELNTGLIDSLLIAPGRYWKVENVSKIEDGTQFDYITEDNNKNAEWLGSYWYGAILTETAFVFGKGVLIEKFAGGVFGPKPYTTQAKFSILNRSEKSSPCGWNGDHTKLVVTLTPMLQGLFKQVSKLEVSNYEGYLDTAYLPIYSNVEEIKTAGKSERIKIILDVPNTSHKVSYVFTLRAVWFDSVGYGSLRERFYDKVIY